MMRLHTGVVHDTISGAWLDAVRHLRSHEGEEFDLVVTTADPTPATCDPMVTAALDELLERKGWQRVATVANTIFPAELAACVGYFTPPRHSRHVTRLGAAAIVVMEAAEDRHGAHAPSACTLLLRRR